MSQVHGLLVRSRKELHAPALNAPHSTANATTGNARRVRGPIDLSSEECETTTAARLGLLLVRIAENLFPNPEPHYRKTISSSDVLQPQPVFYQLVVNAAPRDSEQP